MKQNRPYLKYPLLLLIMAFQVGRLSAAEPELAELLEFDLGKLMRVKVVTASKKAQSLSEVPATVRVITAEQIRERGYFTLEEALADLPGFQFRNIVGFNSYVFLRGAPSQNNLILLLVDGVQINELNSGGFYGGGQFNLSNVKQIEVVYGPASALYGTNAVSGIINIITRDPEEIQGVRVSALAGNFATRTIDFGYGRRDPEKKLGFSVSGLFKQSDKADLGGAEGDHNWTPDMENFEDDLSFDGKLSYDRWKAGLVFQDKQASRTTNYRSTGSSQLDSGTRWHIRFVNGYLTHLYDPHPGWSNRTQLYYRNATVVDNTIAFITSDTGPEEGQAGYYRPNSLVGLENQFTSSLQKNLDLIVGFIWEEERLAENFSKTFSGSPAVEPPTPAKPEMVANRLASLYLQTQYRLLAHTEFTLGFRYDNSSSYGEVTTPRLGVVYNRKELIAKLLYTEAFRAPRPWDYTFGDGNPDLESEEMRSVELAATCLLREQVNAHLSIYRNFLDEKLTREGNRWVNGGKLNTTGLEFALEYAGRTLRPFVNYSFTDSEFKGGEAVPEIGKHTANAGVLYSLTRKARLSLSGRYSGKRKNPKPIQSTGSAYVDPAFVLDAALSFLETRGFNFYFIVKNLLDETYYHTSNRPPDRYRQPQRTIMVKAEHTL